MSGYGSNVIPIDGPSRETLDQALARLYNSHHVALRRFIKVRLGVNEDREDVVQEVYARVAKLDNLPELLPVDGGGNRAYLFRIANNLVINAARHKKVRDGYLDDARSAADTLGGADSVQSPERVAQAQEGLELVRRAIVRMKPHWRHAFLLSRYHQKTYSEVARHMDISVKQVEHYIKSAMVVIRQAVREAGGVQ